MDYTRGWAWQNLLLAKRLERKRHSEADEDIVLFLEHESVYTLGRGADEKYLNLEESRKQLLSRKLRGPGTARLATDRAMMDTALQVRPSEAVQTLSNIATPIMAPNGVPIYRVERGGEVTYHGPGQLVVYPMFDIARDPFRKDLHWFLRAIEDVIIGVLEEFDIQGVRDEINTGVWVGEDKIAAVGLSSSRWITTHGFAINVNPDLSYFDTSVILPCGIEGRGVTSIQKELERRVDSSTVSMELVSRKVRDKLSLVFEIDIEEGIGLD